MQALDTSGLARNPLPDQMNQPEEMGSHDQLINSRDAISLASVDDGSLIRMLIRGRVDALSELYDRYGRLVYNIAVNAVGDQGVAEEIVQDVFMRVWGKAYTYDAGIARVSTWLASITRHRVIDEFRKVMRRPDRTGLRWTEISANERLYGPGPEEQTEHSLQNKLVREALNTLSAGEREALYLAYFRAYSQSEIAAYLHIPLGTVKTRIRMGMQKLRLVLSQTVLEEG
jgi:RNA polymerase sigma-70 factor (ECF subfamily)